MSHSPSSSRGSVDDDGTSEGYCGCADGITREINDFVEKAFCSVGYFVGQMPYIVLFLVLLFLGICCIGFGYTEFESDIFNLWTPTDSPVFAENEFIEAFWSDNDYGLLIISGISKEGESTNVLNSEYLQQWYEIHLDFATQLPHYDYDYIDDDGFSQTIDLSYFADEFYEVPTFIEIETSAGSGINVPHYASAVVPLCRHIAQSPLEAQFEMNCYLLTVLDCFSEGGYFFPYENYLQKTYFGSSVPVNPYLYRDSFSGKNSIELGQALGPSCYLWNGETKEPANYIYGGEVRLDPTDDLSTLIELNSYQIVAYIDSATSIARKLKIAKGQCLYTATFAIVCDDITDEEREEAQEILDVWTLDYINYMKEYTKELNNDENKLWELVFWTPRTAGDLLREASSADFFLLAIAYVAMIIFASLVAIRPSDWFLSRSEASFFGVLLVLLAVLATIGFGSFFVTLSPNVIQVLPFIALGFGVDDMFVLLFSFKYRDHLSVQEMISETTRIAGSSVALTSLANFLGFLVGTFMVLPDVARFATFGALIVLLNFIAVIFGFTAVLALVARRMKSGYNDWSFLFCFPTFTKATKVSSEKAAADSPSIFDPLFDWLTKTYTRVILMVIFVTLIIVGIYGSTLISPGLPLADIVPEDQYAYDFLRIREMFYFSYVVSIYTDAHREQYKPIDWPNKFEQWIEFTEDVYSISDLVYTDPNHDFWAWGFRDYLAEEYDNNFLGEYTLAAEVDISELLAGDPYRYQSFMCEIDRKLYCKYNLVDYNYGSDLFKCLLVNYQYGYITEDDCNSYLVQEVTSNIVLPGIANQIYITSYDNDTGIIDPNMVSGLYSRPSVNDIKVFIKDDSNGIGYIYQSNCGLDECEWYILDESFNILYIGEATETTAIQPGMGGWRNPADYQRVQVTHLYYDFVLDYINITRNLKDSFIEIDIDPTTDFVFSQFYSSSSSSNNYDVSDESSCIQWDIFKLLMTGYEAYEKLEMSNDIIVGDNNTLTDSANTALCNAILEASEICVAIRDEIDLGAIRCGKKEVPTEKTEWFIGHNTQYNDTFNIISSPQNTDNYPSLSDDDLISNITAIYGCNEPDMIGDDLPYNFTYNYLRPCTDNNNFGGFGINKEDNDTLCNQEEDGQIYNLQCQSLTDCTDLRVCYDDIRRLNEEFGFVDDCNLRDIATADGKYRNDPTDQYRIGVTMQSCVLPHYSVLSECCQTATKTQILDIDDFDCDKLENVVDRSTDGTSDDLEQICGEKKKCSYISASSGVGTCSQQCDSNMDVWYDCNNVITDYNCSNLNSTAFIQCVQDGFSVTERFGTTPYDCCQTALSALSTAEEECIHPVTSYYDISTGYYDYSICSDSDISTMIGQPCDNINTGNDTQRDCLIENIANFTDQSSCCVEALIQQTTNTYSVTIECDADTQRLCNGISSGAALYDSTLDPICAYTLLTALAASAVSPKCSEAFITCESIGDWSATVQGSTAYSECGAIYNGNQTRECIALETGPAYWGDIDTSDCMILTCPYLDPYNEDNTTSEAYGGFWAETAVGDVVTIQGGAINYYFNLYASYIQDFDLTDAERKELLDSADASQVPYMMQTMFYEKYGTACNAEEIGNFWYAWRKCGVNEYTGYPEWKEPVVECRGIISWGGVNIHEGATCDLLTSQVTAGIAEQFTAQGIPEQASITTIEAANLIDVIGWQIFADLYTGGVIASHAEQVSTSQQYCSSVLDNCIAFSYDYLTNFTFFFDYCPILTAEELHNESIGIQAVIDSPGYPDTYNAVGFVLTSGTVTNYADYMASWSFYDNPLVPGLTLDSFADNMVTYIAPFNYYESTAQYCSISSLAEVLGDLEAVAADPLGSMEAVVYPYDAWNADGIPHPRCFNNTLWLYFIDPSGGVIYKDKIYFVDPLAIYDTGALDDVQIVTTQNTINIRDLYDAEIGVDFIIALRNRLDEWHDNEIYAIPGGLVLDLFSQYEGVSTHLVNNLLYVSIAVILCGLIFLLNPIAVIVAVLCNFAMIIEVYGFADWFELKVNGVLVLNIVIAVALTMEFTAHIGRAFVLTNVSRRDRRNRGLALPGSNDGQIRMKKTLREMFTPVSLGALTTLIGVAPISAAQFPYFRQYYFTLYVLIVVFGWLNGVIFQVVILSFIPPAPFHMATNSVSSISYKKEEEALINGQSSSNYALQQSQKREVELVETNNNYNNQTNDYGGAGDGDGYSTGDRNKNLPVRDMNDAP